MGNGSRELQGERESPEQEQKAVLLSPVSSFLYHISGGKFKSCFDFVKGQAGFPAGVEMNQAEVDFEIHMEPRL